MQWSVECLGVSMLSDRGYRITCVRMARGYWYNAYSPDGGLPISCGALVERCKLACDMHWTGERRGKLGKRDLRASSRAVPA